MELAESGCGWDKDGDAGMRIIVCGSRHWQSPSKLAVLIGDGVIIGQALVGIDEQPITVVTGGAKGVDSLAVDIATSLGWLVEIHRADWKRHGKAAGPIRNQIMADLGADLCLVFPLEGSIGTWDMVRRAEAAGIHTEVWGYDADEVWG